MIYDIILNYLIAEPRARERANKDRGMVNILIKRYPSLETIDKQILIDMVRDYNSMDRAWRKVMEEHEELRGTDYSLKSILEERKKIELGYSPNYYQDIKQLALLK